MQFLVQFVHADNLRPFFKLLLKPNFFLILLPKPFLAVAILMSMTFLHGDYFAVSYL